MDKLLDLLNEYRAEHDIFPVKYDEKDLDSLWILKRFVKWLVDNDKIDLHKMKNSDLFIFDEFADNYLFQYEDCDYLIVIMLLSIQDSPIDFLVSILK